MIGKGGEFLMPQAELRKNASAKWRNVKLVLMTSTAIIFAIPIALLPSAIRRVQPTAEFVFLVVAPDLWNSVSTWITAPCLYVLVNIVIVILGLISRAPQTSKNEQPHNYGIFNRFSAEIDGIEIQPDADAFYHNIIFEPKFVDPVQKVLNPGAASPVQTDLSPAASASPVQNDLSRAASPIRNDLSPAASPAQAQAQAQKSSPAQAPAQAQKSSPVQNDLSPAASPAQIQKAAAALVVEHRSRSFKDLTAILTPAPALYATKSILRRSTTKLSNLSRQSRESRETTIAESGSPAATKTSPPLVVFEISTESVGDYYLHQVQLNEDADEGAMVEKDAEPNMHRQEDGTPLSSDELYAKAESFIGNFYNQLKMQREDSWNRLCGIYKRSC